MADSKKSPPSVSPESENIVKQGLESIKWLFFLHTGSRFITFALNTAIARTVPQSSFAIAHLQLQLLLNIVLPLSREAFRRAISRAPKDAQTLSSAHKLQARRLLNLSYLSIPLGALLSLFLTIGFLFTSTKEELATKGYYTTIVWTGAAAFAEMLSEPLYILAQHRLMFGTRTAVELVAIGIKSILSYIMIVHLGMGLESFGIVTLAYSLLVSVGYWTYFGLISPLPEFPTLLSLLPQRAEAKGDDGKPQRLSWKNSVDWDLARYLGTFEWQTLQKMLLQEGEKILLRGAETLEVQGIFALVNVLGSLVVRFVFAWLEEGLFPLFSKILVQYKSITGTGFDDVTLRNNLLRKAYVVLSLLCRLLTYIGLIFACFGPSYSYLLLDILYTKKYSQTAAPNFLAWFCVYILTMAINGITEAFAHAAAPPRVLNWFNFAMVGQSVLFVASSLVLVRAQVQAALIISSIIVMSTRIFISVGFIRRFFVDNFSEKNVFSLSALFPGRVVITLFVIAHLTTRLSESYWCSMETGTTLLGCAQHVAVGGVAFLGVLSVAVLVVERHYFRSLWHFIRTRDV